MVYFVTQGIFGMKKFINLLAINISFFCLISCGGGGGGSQNNSGGGTQVSSTSSVIVSSSSISSSISSTISSIRSSSVSSSSSSSTSSSSQSSSSSTPQIADLSSLPKANKFAVDTSRNYLFISHKDAYSITVLDTKTNHIVSTIKFDLMPEKMFLSLDKTKLYVALLKRDHNFLWIDDQSGAIAVIDVPTLKVTSTFALDIDPYDLLVTSKNKLIVSGGSGQWTSMNAYDAITGKLLGVAKPLRQTSHIAVSTNEKFVYSLEMDDGSKAFQKFDISGEGIESTGTAMYQSEHRYQGNLWATPDGKYLISRGGDLYLTADFTYVLSLIDKTQTINDMVIDQSNNVAIMMLSDDSLKVMNLGSLQTVSTIKTFGDAVFSFVSGEELFVVVEQSGVISLIKQPNPCSTCATNKAPVAAFTFTPVQGNTSSTYVFDSSTSSDPDKDNLVYRWDWESDGIWDTEFAADNIINKKFTEAGVHYVSLQVKDTSGMTAVSIQPIKVDKGADAGTLVSNSTPNLFDFSANYIQADANNNKLYVADRSAKRVYVVDVKTGLTEKYFSFDAYPESMSISSDQKYLVVALPIQNHSSFWRSEDQSGFVGVIDLSNQTLVYVFKVDTDPKSVVGTKSRVFVSSGSGQGSLLKSYNVEDGSFLSSTYLYEGASLTVDATGTYLYSSDFGLSPSGIYQYDVSSNSIAGIASNFLLFNSVSQGKLWLVPGGQFLIASCGEVFSTWDMKSYKNMIAGTQCIQSLAFDVPNNRVVIVDTDKKIFSYSLDGFSDAVNLAGPVDPREVVYVNGSIYLLVFELGKYKLEKL